MKKFPPTKLTPGDRQALTVLTYQPGFKVLQHLMEIRVQQATVQMLEVAPDDPQRSQKISDLQGLAYAMNSFCADLLQDINWQVQAEMAEQDAKTTPEVDMSTQAFLTAAARVGLFVPEEN